MPPGGVSPSHESPSAHSRLQGGAQRPRIEPALTSCGAERHAYVFERPQANRGERNIKGASEPITASNPCLVASLWAPLSQRVEKSQILLGCHKPPQARLNLNLALVFAGVLLGGYMGFRREGCFALGEQVGPPSCRKHQCFDRVSSDPIPAYVSLPALRTDSRERLDCIEDLAYPTLVRPEENGQPRKCYCNVSA